MSPGLFWERPMTELIADGALSAEDIFCLLTSDSLRGKYVIWPAEQPSAGAFWIYPENADDLSGMLAIKKN